MTTKTKISPGDLTSTLVRALLADAIETGKRGVVDDCRDWLDCAPYGGDCWPAAHRICAVLDDRYEICEINHGAVAQS